LILVLISGACIRTINPPIRKVAPALVVEGSVTTDPPPYTVNLSYSGQYDNAVQIPQELYIPDAHVVMRDDQGDSSICDWVSNGSYQTIDTSFVGTVGRTYTVTITLSNGKTYVSKPEKISAAPPIDSLTVFYDSSYLIGIRPSQLILSVHTRDPAGVSNYYRWTADGYVPRKSSGFPCSWFSPPCGIVCSCFALCDQYMTNQEVNVLSDQFTDGNEIIQPVFYSPVYWFGSHDVEVKQYSLSLEAYSFWQAYLAQTNRTGSILDPLPSSLVGNVYNRADSNEVALGLFSASAVRSAKVIITPFFLQQYYLLSIAGSFITYGDCHTVYPNSLPDDASPGAWAGADSINLY
jgi:hypothetical protein